MRQIKGIVSQSILFESWSIKFFEKKYIWGTLVEWPLEIREFLGSAFSRNGKNRTAKGEVGLTEFSTVPACNPK